MLLNDSIKQGEKKIILLNKIKNMSKHMARVEYKIAQQLHKQKSEILKNTTLMISGSNSSVIWRMQIAIIQ